MRKALRDAAMAEARARVLDACLQQSRHMDGQPLEVLINDTLYHERRRFENDRALTVLDDAAFWTVMKERLGRAPSSRLPELLDEILRHYDKAIGGHFSPTFYQVSTKVIPKALPLLLNALHPTRMLLNGMPSVAETVRVEGAVESLTKLSKRGTVILLPTHATNLDSYVMAYAIYAMGLEPFGYGAAASLFQNPAMAPFISLLGAYRVDRFRTAPLYKDLLKEFTAAALERRNSMFFFPAGTRSRSGALERKLKLGLLSTGLRAYIENLRHRRSQPEIYLVPCTLNHQLVLEAETLIDEHLQTEGGARYIPRPDSSSMPRQVLRFFENILNVEAQITVRIGEPLDPFGNRVDPDSGRSLDARGRELDISRYVRDRQGEAVHLPQRDRVYTREAGASVLQSFLRNNVILATTLVAFTFWETIRLRHPDFDTFRLIRSGDEGAGISLQALYARVQHVWAALSARVMRGELRLEPGLVAHGDAPSLVEEALRVFGSYHSQAVLVRRGERVFCEDMKLLYFYANRLRHYGLEQELEPILREVSP